MYIYYLQNIFDDLLKIYRVYSDCIANAQQSHVQTSKQMKMVRRDILKLVGTYVEHTNDFTHFRQFFLPQLKNLIDDYQMGAPQTRDPEVLQLFATMFKHMGD